MGAQPRGNIFVFFKVVIKQVCYIMGTPNASNSNNVFNVNSNENVPYYDE